MYETYAPPAPPSSAMHDRRGRQLAQANAHHPAANAGHHPPAIRNAQDAAHEIGKLQQFIARCGSGDGYSSNPWSGDTQAGGVGSPKSSCLIRADIGSVRGMAIDQKAYVTVIVEDDGTVTAPDAPTAVPPQVFITTAPGTFSLQLSLSPEDQASFNGKIINNVGTSLTVDGDFPDAFDSGQLIDTLVRRSKLKVITGGTENINTQSTLAFVAILYSSQFPKAGADLGIRNMSGVWQATKFQWLGRNFPDAPPGLTYQTETDVVLVYGQERPGMYAC